MPHCAVRRNRTRRRLHFNIGGGADNSEFPTPRFGNRHPHQFYGQQSTFGQLWRLFKLRLNRAAYIDQRLSIGRATDDAGGEMASRGTRMPAGTIDPEFNKLSVFNNPCAHFAGCSIP